MELWTAFMLGFLGSAHCIGMCGPIALGVTRKESLGTSIFQGLLYNSGRILTYAIFGLVFGLLGMGATLAGYQNILSIILGVLIIAFALFPKLKFDLSAHRYLASFSGWLSKTIGKLFNRRSSSSVFLIGTLNGFLPCGFVITALAAALITSSAFHSSAYMALFGLGTLPAMLFMNIAPHVVKPELRSKLRPLSTYFAIFLGFFLIYRGIMVTGGHMMHHGM